MTADMVKRAGISIAVFLTVLSISLYSLSEIRDSFYQDKKHEAYTFAKSYTDVIEKIAIKAGRDAASFATNVQYKGGPSKWFSKEAAAFMDEHPEIIGMELVQFGKKNTVVDYPKNFSIEKEPGIIAVIKNVQDNFNDGDSDPMLIGPVDLVDKTKAAVCIVPVFTYNAKLVKFEQWGSLTVLYKLPDLIAEAKVTSIPESNYIYALYGNNPLLENDGEILASATEMPAVMESSSAVVPQGLWLLKVAPDTGFNFFIPVAAAVGISVLLGLLAGGLTFKSIGE